MSPPPNELLETIPDVPRWAYTRGTLLSGHSRVLSEPGGSVISHPRLPLITTVGRPAHELILRAVEEMRPRVEVIVQKDDRDWVSGALPDWKCLPAIVHLLPPGWEPRLPEGSDVRILEPEERPELGELPADWQEEVGYALERSAGFAAFVDGRAVSFCVISYETETLCDIAVVTAEKFRRRGLSTACAANMIRRVRESGKEPLWGTEENNAASLRMAARLGFVPVDGLFVFARPSQDST